MKTTYEHFESSSLELTFKIDDEGDSFSCSIAEATINNIEHDALPSTRQVSKTAAFGALCDTLLRYMKNLPSKPKKADLAEFEEWMSSTILSLSIDQDAYAANALAEGEAAAEAVEAKQMQEDITEKESTLAELRTAQQERQELISSAFRMMGRIEGIKAMTEIGDIATLTMLSQVKKSKVYKEMPGVGTWEKYCESIGYGRRYLDERLEDIELLGEKLLAMIATFQIPILDHRHIRNAVKDGTLAITDKSVIIDVEPEDITEDSEPQKLEIPYKNKEELQNVLADVIEQKNKELKAAKEAAKDSEHIVKTKDKQMDALSKDNRKLEEKLKAYTDGGEIKGMPAEDFPVYEKLKSAMDAATELYAHINTIAKDLENLSEANQHYLGGTIYYINDLSIKLCHAIGVRGVAADRILNPPADVTGMENALIPGVRMAPGHKA